MFVNQFDSEMAENQRSIEVAQQLEEGTEKQIWVRSLSVEDKQFWTDNSVVAIESLHMEDLDRLYQIYRDWCEFRDAGLTEDEFGDSYSESGKA